MACKVYYIDNVNVLELEGLYDVVGAAYINDAVVEVTLYNLEDDEEILGATWPQNLTYVTSSDGNYRGYLTELTVTAYQQVYAIIEAFISGSLVFHVRRDFTVIRRKDT